ncbi:acyl-CoA synthetase [Microbacterium terrisoli]|uniref:acyl-CoA synthetase n=1 Tax=Microbacterium terrisoli TaxID=3242192 RepID=UPI002803F6FD|nr:acyl-CoA synthetase [Microbacterium protaetiae]
MSPARTARSFEVRHLQLARAVIAAIAAAMITFSPDHSAPLGLSVFSGFAITSAFVLFVAAWLVFPAGRRGAAVVLGVIDIVAGMVAGIGPIRSDTLFFALVISWALASGLVELIVGLRGRHAEKGTAAHSEGRDALTIGILGLVLGVALLCVPAGYALTYRVAEAHETFTLTGITIGVGIFGGYAAIVAVFLGIAGFSPRVEPAAELAAGHAASEDNHGGAA